MKNYYTKNGEKLHTVTIPDSLIMDCSKMNLDFWEAKKIIFSNPHKKAFIFKHKGIGIPTGKEIVVTHPEIIQLTT